MDYRKHIVELLQPFAEIPANQIEIPRFSDHGNYAVPCFNLAREMKKSPQQIAKDLADTLGVCPPFSRIEAVGPYLNFFIDKTTLAKDTLGQIFTQKDKYGMSDVGKGRSALIEHTSINPNASPHLGRVRNAVIGDVLARLLKFSGYNTSVHYFVNDVGKQIAMLAYACKDHPDVTFDQLLKVYVEVNEQIKNNPEIEKDIFALLVKLESGDEGTRKLFRHVVDVCIAGQQALLSEIGISYDVYDYESQYLWNHRAEQILAMFEETGRVFIDEHGRKILDLKGFNLPMKTPVAVLTRGDGTTLYTLRDLAYTIDKMKKGRDKNIVVLGEDHKLYYKQLKASLSLIGHDAPEVVHYSFVLLKDGKMSTRRGNVVLLSDFMAQAKEKAKKEVLNRNPAMDTKQVEELSKAIGYGAIRYSIIKVSSEKNVTFDWDRALSFEGDSAPYIQYAYARINSILEKADVPVTLDIDFSLFGPEEYVIITKLFHFYDVIQQAVSNLKPHLIAVYTAELAQLFSEYYHVNPILSDNRDLMLARMLLVDSVRQVLRTGLWLIGIEAPKHM